ncbi:MAG TPA: hypothetical protein PLC26_10335, partial [Bacillota bacterium]|nr:hypothetical protein [Bacillota bacterium]
MKNNTIDVLSKQTVISPEDPGKLQQFTKVSCWITQAAKKQIVLIIAITTMLITCFFVPVDASYLDYFNWNTLATLYCTLAVVEALSNIHVFE